ncbi:hypothetical protein GE21DRAFT_1041326 [Neurospora crassa]|nr:hypothetical protein GE21DRAFT_1041326 [Neurospora crassa]
MLARVGTFPTPCYSFPCRRCSQAALSGYLPLCSASADWDWSLKWGIGGGAFLLFLFLYYIGSNLFLPFMSYYRLLLPSVALPALGLLREWVSRGRLETIDSRSTLSKFRAKMGANFVIRMRATNSSAMMSITFNGQALLRAPTGTYRHKLRSPEAQSRNWRCERRVN